MNTAKMFTILALGLGVVLGAGRGALAGKVVAWGDNGGGQCDVPLPNEGFVAVAAGGQHSLGLKGEPIMGTAFTYQGRLLDADSAADGLYDLEFRLYDSEDVQNGNTIEADNVDVIDGYFTVVLDFGTDVFDGLARWLQVGVRPSDSNDPNAFVILSPRQEVTPAPYAVYAKTANYAKSSGTTATGITGTGTTNYLPKFIDSNTVSDSVIYEYGGNVGIGTTNPTSLLDVFGGEIRARRDSVQYIKIRDFDPNGGFIMGHSLENNKKGLYIQNLHDGSGSPRGDTFMSFIVGNKLSPTRAMMIKESGNVGIGTTAPTEKLDVAGNVTASKYYDRDDTSYYVDPDSTSVCDVLQANFFYDRRDPNYFVSPASIISAKLAGDVESYGSNGNLNARFTSLTGYVNKGYVGVYDDIGSRRAGVYVNSLGGGRMNTVGPNGNTNVGITNLNEYPNNGYVSVYDKDGTLRAGVYVNSLNGGEMWTIGPNGNTNVAITNWYLNSNNGSVGVYDSDGDKQAEMYVNLAGQGVVSADTKSFRVASPDQPDKEIWYTCLEGPEAAAYVRGTGHLTNGKAEVGLPDHFVAVASPQGITVQVTPLSAESRGLAVVEKATDHFVVRELAGGDGTYDFDYMVTAVRKGYENYQVIRSAIEAGAVKAGEAGI